MQHISAQLTQKQFSDAAESLEISCEVGDGTFATERAKVLPEDQVQDSSKPPSKTSHL